MKSGIVFIYITKIGDLCMFDHFLSFFDIKLTSIDVNMSPISINIYLTHQQTANIDINHHKNHWKVLLWSFTQPKLTILRIFDHFDVKSTSLWRHYDVKVMSDKIFSTSFGILIKFSIRESIICLAKMYFSVNRRTFKAIFMQKALKMTKNVNFMTS